VARVTERINHRAERTSEDLAERIRQSEERTARLLEDAREKIDQRLAQAQGQTLGQTAAQARAAVAPEFAQTAPPPIELAAFPAAEAAPASAFSDDPFAGFPAVDDRTPPEPSASDFMARAFPSSAGEALAQAAAPAPRIALDDADDEDDEGEPLAGPDDVLGEAADESLSDNLVAPALAEAAPEDDADLDPAPFGASAAFGREPAEQAFFDADDAFGPMAQDADDASVDDLFDLPPETKAEQGRPLTTREVVEQARAAARAAAQNTDAKGRKGKAPSRAGSPLFSGFGLSRPKRRAGSTLQTFLLVSGGAAFLGLAAGGVVMMNAKPAGAPPKRVAEALAVREAASRPVAGSEVDPASVPRASVALAPQPIAATPEVNLATPDAGVGVDLPGLYSGAVTALETGQPGGLETLRKAANLGHAPAQLYLGKLFEEGKSGVKKDMAEARRWTERAAVGGDRRAMHNVALYHFNGEGGPKNAASAAQWFRRAADMGLVDSQFNLGRLDQEGLGVAQNNAEAYKWFLIAARAGDEGARAKAQEVGAKLTTQGRAVAERTALAFRPAVAGAGTGLAAAGDSPTRTAQKALSKLGYYQGPTDGSASPALKMAVAAYQRDQGLSATGALDSTTVSRLAVFTR
jgi:localization factor PodJL